MVKSIYWFRHCLAAILLTCLVSLSAKAQVSVILNTPASDQLTSANIFSFSLSNNSSQPITLAVEGSLELASGKPVYWIRYTNMMLNPGVAAFNFGNLVTQQERYGNSEQGELMRSTGMVPYGSYVLCLNVYNAADNNLLASNCIEQSFGPHSPPELMNPEDEAEIETTLPLLSWIPPSPVQSGSHVSYVLKITEIMEHQSAMDALLRNAPLYSNNNIDGTALLYPADAMPLEIGKSYAWQVAASNRQYDLGKTEVWRFKIVSKDSTPPRPEPPISGSYLKLRNSMDGSYSLVIGDLRFVYEDQYRSGNLQYRITDLYGKDFTPKDLSLENELGDNRYVIPLKKKAKLKSNTYYLLEVFTPKKERKVLVFKYYKSEQSVNH